MIKLVKTKKLVLNFVLSFCIFVFGFLILISSVSAAVLTASQQTTSVGNKQIILQINTQGEKINTVAAKFSFNPDNFFIKDMNDGGSIINLWVQKPEFSNDAGAFDFAGIIPGGYEGKNGKILTVEIIPKITGPISGLSFVSGEVLLNDGEGTKTNLSFSSAPLENQPSPTIVDNQPPDVFTPVIGQNSNIFDGKYFVAFGATDQLSGISHYEVAEEPPLVFNSKNFGWRVASSPYLLQDQTLSSNIYVKAVDNAGNYRIEKIPARYPFKNRVSEIIIAIIVLLLIGVIGIYFLKWKKKKFF